MLELIDEPDVDVAIRQYLADWPPATLTDDDWKWSDEQIEKLHLL